MHQVSSLNAVLITVCVNLKEVDLSIQMHLQPNRSKRRRLTLVQPYRNLKQA